MAQTLLNRNYDLVMSLVHTRSQNLHEAVFSFLRSSNLFSNTLPQNEVIGLEGSNQNEVVFFKSGSEFEVPKSYFISGAELNFTSIPIGEQLDFGLITKEEVNLDDVILLKFLLQLPHHLQNAACGSIDSLTALLKSLDSFLQNKHGSLNSSLLSLTSRTVLRIAKLLIT
jgi:hypothetical protein